jgi:hypothetical protein
MHKLNIFVFFSLFIVEVDTATYCHLSYKPIGMSCTLSSLDYVQPIFLVSLTSTSTALPSALAIIEEDETDNILLTNMTKQSKYHWTQSCLGVNLPDFLAYIRLLEIVDCCKKVLGYARDKCA